MSRSAQILIYTHAYILTMICQLHFGNKELLSQVSFNVLPIIFIFLLLGLWKRTSSIKLTWHERQFINYFIFCFAILHFYYIACFFEINTGNVGWIRVHNQYFFYYGLVTTLFYTFINVARRSKFR